MNNQFKVFGVNALDPEGNEAIGHVIQTKVEHLTYQFYVISNVKLKEEFELEYNWVYEDFKLMDVEIVEVTDLEVVEMSRGVNNRIVPQRIESLFIKARAALIDYDNVYGAAVYEGQYINDGFTTWFYASGTHPETGKALDVVYFSEIDDGSYSLYFNINDSKLAYIIYEN